MGAFDPVNGETLLSEADMVDHVSAGNIAGHIAADANTRHFTPRHRIAAEDKSHSGAPRIARDAKSRCMQRCNVQSASLATAQAPFPSATEIAGFQRGLS
jgi:hypothetical protein